MLGEGSAGLALSNWGSSTACAPGKCYVYGSLHATAPRVESLLNVLRRVDYVLLEGFDTGSWEELVEKHPLTFLGIMAVLLLLKGEKNLFIKPAGWVYSRFHGIEFRGDMEYVARLAREMGKNVEVADSSFREVYMVRREAYTSLYKLFISSAIISVVSLIALISQLKFLIDILLVLLGIPPSFPFAPLVLVLFITLVTHPIVLAIIYVKIFLACGHDFIDRINDIRDSKVVKRVHELVASGHSVLVVRGKAHVGYIVRELRAMGIPCEVVP